MKTLFTTVCLIMMTYFCLQAGTRYSVNSGDWDNTSTWSTTSGGSSGASVPGVGDIVVIEDEEVTVNSIEQCDSIYMRSGSGDDSKLLIEDNGDLTVIYGTLLSTQSNKNKVEIEISGSSGFPGTMSIGSNLNLMAYDDQDEAKVKVKEDGSLTITGNVSLWANGDKEAELKLEDDGVCTILGDVLYEGAEKGSLKINMNDNGLMNLAGNFDRSASGNYGDLDCEETTTINFNGTSAQVFSMINYGGAVTNEWTYGEVRINNTAGVTLDADISQSDETNTVLDDIRVMTGQLNSGGYSIELANGKFFEMAGTTTYSTTTTDGTGGMLQTSTSASHSIHVNSTVNFAATSAQNVPDPSNNESYGNVTLSGGATKTLTDNVDINGDLLITANAALDVGNGSDYTIDLAGNWTDNGTFIERNGEVTFDGSSPQAINGNSEEFYDLTVDNSSGDVSLSADITVTRTLNLSSGDIVLGANDLTMDVDATISNGGASSYVQADNEGVMTKNFNGITTPFDFPVGDNDEFSPFWFKLQGGTSFGGGDNISIKVTDAKHANMAEGDHITRFWRMNSGGFSAIKYGYKAVYLDEDIVGTETNLKAAKWNGSSWSAYNAVNPAINTLSNSIGITTIPSNHDFTGGSGGALPIELLSFRADVETDRVVLYWSTAVEINNDYFTIERSNDGFDYEVISTINGQGTTYQSTNYKYVDSEPITGTSYYRLKQTDVDHQFEYFAPIAVHFVSVDKPTIKLYPNPVLPSQSLQVILQGFTPDEEVMVVLVDQYGREVYSKVLLIQGDEITTAIDLNNKLIPGVYFVIGSSNKSIYQQRLIISGDIIK